MVLDWWEQLFEQMLDVATYNLRKIEENQDGSDEALCLLIEAVDSFNFIQQAYHDKCFGGGHAEFFKSN
jgi:hypothetical protein|tara:strand:+ start:387 stop:593 length:207 start_codon:yes stop_codon:yes gene_type:complete